MNNESCLKLRNHFIPGFIIIIIQTLDYWKVAATWQGKYEDDYASPSKGKGKGKSKGKSKSKLLGFT